MVPPPAHRWPHQSGCDLASCPLPHHSCPFEPFFLFPVHPSPCKRARRAKGDDLAYIEACLDPVLQKAGLRRSDFTLYIQDTAELNAYAFGDHHIVVFKGLLDQLPMDEVSGVLAHELGHLHYHHTQWLLLSYGMNLPITFVSGIYRAIVFMLRIFLIIPILGLLISLMVFFCNLWIQALSFTMNFPLHLLRLVKARQDEYAADRYAFEIGYGVELHNALFDISGGGADAPGFLAAYGPITL